MISDNFGNSFLNVILFFNRFIIMAANCESIVLATNKVLIVDLLTFVTYIWNSVVQSKVETSVVALDIAKVSDGGLYNTNMLSMQ